MTKVRRAGLVFIVLFVGAFILSGEIFGGFADPDQFFIELFQDAGARVRVMVGSYLMALAGLAFAWFAGGLADLAKRHAGVLRLTGYAAAGGMLLAAVAAATTPMSVWFGALVDDPGIQQGQGVLPQFAYVALFMGGLLPAGIFIIGAARSPGLLPRWLAFASYPVGALVAIAAITFIPMVLFPVWIIVVVITAGKQAAT
ncbi:MAG: hypothetical protein IH941_10015 [Acidobacteria bacterium]|nr:hypothetical protein [Acidobacteriota bacterium]